MDENEKYAFRFSFVKTVEPSNPTPVDNANRSAVTVVSGSPSVAPVVPESLTIVLDRSQVVAWSINGVNPDELTRTPDNCRVSRHVVKCAVVLTTRTDLISAALNHVCFPIENEKIRCEMVFFVNRPNVKFETKTAALSKALPF